MVGRVLVYFPILVFAFDTCNQHVSQVMSISFLEVF